MRRNRLLILKSEIRSRRPLRGQWWCSRLIGVRGVGIDEEELLDFLITELSDFDDNSSELSDSEDEE